ncbi:MAG: hypothetical protein ACKOCN_02330 [Planctomycetaceae bacterium]
MARSTHILGRGSPNQRFGDRSAAWLSRTLIVTVLIAPSTVTAAFGDDDLPDSVTSARELIEKAVSQARDGATRVEEDAVASPSQVQPPAGRDGAIPVGKGGDSVGRGLPPELLAAQLSAEVAAKQLEARRLAERSPAEALGLLDATAERLAAEDISPETRDRLVRRIVRTKRDIEQMTGRRQSELELDASNAAIEADIERRQAAKSATEERLALLIEEYNDLIDARRFAEAEAIAKKAAQLSPDNPVTRQLLAQSRVIRRLESQRSIEGSKQAAYLEDAEDTERASAGFVGPIEFPDTHRWEDLTKNRSRLASEGRLRASPAEVVIEKKLSTPVTVSHRDQPLSAVLDDLGKQAGIPIHLDRPALDGEGVGTDTAITLMIDRPISLKSALKLVLEPLQLDTVIRDEVLKVTSPRLVKGEFYSVTYPVADLVIAVPNFSSDGLGLTGALRDGYSRLPQAGGRPAQPVAAPAGINGVSSTGGETSIHPTALAQIQLQGGGQPVMGSSPSIPFGPPTVGGGAADFQTLINLIQAAQGNTRSNVMQAPKVTLFNGQNAFVSDTIQRPFVTSVVPVVGDFAAAQQPVITVLSEGTAVNVQAVVSNDRRFVRLTLVPFFSSIGSVQEFQFEGTRSTRSKTTDEESGADVETVGTNPLNAGLNFGAAQSNEAEVLSSGTTIQLPEFIFTTVTTTVSVPDGGTVLLGGIKRLREGRNEFGVPILSKIPYINRLFKNVGIGRTTESLMMMVTPRIIIQEEEEARILGTEKP